MSSPFRRKRPLRHLRTINDRTGVSSSFSIRKLSLFITITFVFIFAFASVHSYVQSQWQLSSQTLKQWTSQMSEETFVAALSMEMPYLQMYHRSTELEIPQASHILLEMITSFNPEDPRSLIRHEIPGFAFFDGEIIRAGEGVSYTDIPMESSPPLEVVMAEREAVAEQMNGAVEGDGDGSAQTGEESSQPERTTEGDEVVYIYHTHTYESWLPHIPDTDDPNEAFHHEINITKVGERLGEELEKRGVGTQVDTSDIPQKLSEQGLDFADSYEVSREVVEAHMQENEEIKFMFDLHRDSVGRDQTTTDIDDEDYARTAIVVGQGHADYEKNLAFAEELEERIEAAYPGLNRMIYMPEKGNGEYNQSLSENNILIEIGGIENTLEESYRTAEALADVIADLYWEKADGVSAE